MGADQSGVEQLIALGTATLGESGASVADSHIGPVWPGAACAGPALTVRCAAGDNLAVHVAVASLHAGEVLVVHCEGVPDRGYWGEVLTVAAQARGCAGLVIDACVRDTRALAARRFPVFSTGIALRGASKAGPGSTGEAVTIGGASIELGHVVVADADGIVVITPSAMPEVTAAACERAAAEQTMFADLASGRSTLELLGVHDVAFIHTARHLHGGTRSETGQS